MGREGYDLALKKYGYLEKEARAFCDLASIDAEKRIQHGRAEFGDESGFYKADLHHTPQWVFVARDLEQFQKTQQQEKWMREVLTKPSA